MPRTKVSTRIPDTWLPRLRGWARARGIPDPRPGRSGGIPLILRQLLAEVLGAELPDYHDERRRERQARLDEAAGATLWGVVSGARVQSTHSTEEAARAAGVALVEEARARGRRRVAQIVSFGVALEVRPGWRYTAEGFAPPTRASQHTAPSAGKSGAGMGLRTVQTSAGSCWVWQTPLGWRWAPTSEEEPEDWSEHYPTPAAAERAAYLWAEDQAAAEE